MDIVQSGYRFGPPPYTLNKTPGVKGNTSLRMSRRYAIPNSSGTPGDCGENLCPFTQQCLQRGVLIITSDEVHGGRSRSTVNHACEFGLPQDLLLRVVQNDTRVTGEKTKLGMKRVASTSSESSFEEIKNSNRRP